MNAAVGRGKAQQSDKHQHSGWPPFAEELDSDMMDILKTVQEIVGEMKLMRYRIEQLETVTKIGIGMYLVTVISLIGIAVSLWVR